ncbi:sperm-associated antigen 17 [Myripristis murdjan]|uniref:sperm-associated antigen 17 n=1 Tax=Myripristis murdjan TaxID=586833 RepID=UPI001175CB25|nr:sperm-associated antigen 17 [Myripristis murdjan]
MPPKRVRTGNNAAAGAAAANRSWEAGLTEAKFEEDSWRACVSLVVGHSPEDEELIEALGLAVQKPLRKLFTLLTWDNTLAKIHELGNPKTKKPKNVPVFYEVTEPAKVLLDAGQEIPCDLMAKILKFQLLEIKANDQHRRAAEQVSAEEKKAKLQAGSSSATKAKGGAKASDNKAKKPPQPSGPSQEKETKLKRRGQNVEPLNFIDDEPDDGPHQYILLLGFHQPQLLSLLDALGVHVANVIKLCSDTVEEEVHGGEELADQARKLQVFWSDLSLVLDSAPPGSRLYDVTQLSYTVRAPPLPLHTEDPKSVLALGSQIFDGVACLIYDCLDWYRQHKHYQNNIRFIKIPTVIRLEPAEDIQNMQHMGTAPPTTPGIKKKARQEDAPLGLSQENELPPFSADVDMRYYSSLLDLIPPEASSVPLILHCMLEQVVISTEQSLSLLSQTADEPRASSGFWIDCQLVNYMLHSFLPLVHTEEERNHMVNSLLTLIQDPQDKKRLEEEFGVEKAQRKAEGHPLVFRHHDERALRLRQISKHQGFDPVEVELSMMKLTPLWQLIHSAALQRNNDLCRMAVKQQLQHYCTAGGVPWLEVERLLRLSVLESVPLTGLDQQGLLLNTAGAQQHPPLLIPWDDPLSYAKQPQNRWTKGQTFLTEDPGSSEQTSRSVCGQLNLSAIQSCRLRFLSDWHYTEHHSAAVFPQVLQSASEAYCCVDTFQGSLDNILYIICHSPMSPQRQCKQFWDMALHTDVGFRKYLEHVADSISNWTREEEAKREATQLRTPSPAESLKGDTATDSRAEEATPDLCIRKDSLKAWKLEQDRLKEEEMAKKSKKDNTRGGKAQRERVVSAASTKENKIDDSKALSGRKKSRGETASSSSKSPTASIAAAVPPVEDNKELQPAEEPFSGFIGYTMDGKLIQVSGQLQHLFPSDGGHITVENITYVEGSSLMKVCVRKDGHHFYTHINNVTVETTPKPEGKESKELQETKEERPVGTDIVRQGSFTAVLNNGVHLSYSYYGPTGQYKVSPQVLDGGVPQTVSVSAPPIPSEHSAKAPDEASSSSMTQSPASQTRPQESQSKVCEGQPSLPAVPFNSLNLSVPNGLLLQFLTEDIQGVSSGEQSILVRQSFPLQSRRVASGLQDPSLSGEFSRIVTSQGTVVRHMRDGSTEVLFADGSVSFSQDSGPVWVPESEVEEEKTSPPECREAQSNKKGKSSKNDVEPEIIPTPQRGCWLTTTPSGARISTVGNTHKCIPITPVLAFHATDPFTHDVMLSREDRVVSTQSTDGSLTVEHADGTKITTLYQDRESNMPPHTLLQTGEQPESPYTPTMCDNEEGSGSNSAGNACDKEGTRHNVFAEETIGNKSKGSSYESGKASVSAKERVLLVEKEGFATVVMYPEQHTAHVFLADGTVVTGSSHGAYEVFPSGVGILQIQSNGKCLYSSDPLMTPSPQCGTPGNKPGSYIMSHTDKVACDFTDHDGNHFQVMEDGQISALISSPASSTLEQEEQEEEEDGEMARLHVKHREHCPRFFVVHEDGSGTELLSSQTVEELLYQAHCDPAVALMKEALPDTQGEFGITILKPSHQSVWSQWLLQKQNPDIIPANLRNRSWHDFPRVEGKTPGPPLGSDLGVGLTLKERSSSSPVQRQPVRSCPEALVVRELSQHRPVTTQLRRTLDTRLKEYMESVLQREQLSEDMKLKDPRTEEERARASDLLNLVLSLPEAEHPGHCIEKRNSVDIASLYSQVVSQSQTSEDTPEAASNGKESQWTKRLAQHRQELCEDKAYREILRNRIIVPYFHPENTPLHQSHQQTPDMRRLTMDLPPCPRTDDAEAFLQDAPQENPQRPLNPTPSHAASHVAQSDVMPAGRPTNPTPQTAGDSSLRGSSGQCKSVHLDVTGNPRRTKVCLPTSILTSKPCSIPNQQFLSVEEPVRRKCRTISLINPNSIARGFELRPSSVDFGKLREGTLYAVTVVMTNVGVDTCRFTVKQPPPASGLRVIYNPGPVAAGLQVQLHVQLFAMSAVQEGEAEPKNYISQNIPILTETEILYLPVTATILPDKLYDRWLNHQTNPHKKCSRVHQLSSTPPVRRGAQLSHRQPPPLTSSAADLEEHLNPTTSV